jgi:hypothetical protein
MSAGDLPSSKFGHDRDSLIDLHTAPSPAPGEDADHDNLFAGIDELLGLEAQLFPGVRTVLCVAAQPVVTTIGRALELTCGNAYELAIFGPIEIVGP